VDGGLNVPSGRPRTVARAPAKLNLALEVGDVRADGFHELSTVYHSLNLFDTVTAQAADELGLRLTGTESGGVPAGPANLAWRAAESLARVAGRRPEVSLTVEKVIPVAAGLAGGSADAAATLVACDQLWGLDTPLQNLLDLAAELGSDVPFALLGGTALGTGRGERITPVDADIAAHWVIAIADFGLSTPDVYRQLDRMRGDGGTRSAELGEPTRRLLHRLAAADPPGLAAALTNDLEPAAIALAPRLAATLAAGRAAGAVGAIVSGSGPTCAFLARDGVEAARIADALTAQRLCRTALVTSGPARGALRSVSAAQ
jgi:4-diphosphocytidyl-2-C-methyl-D-erythritol kinase